MRYRRGIWWVPVLFCSLLFLGAYPSFAENSEQEQIYKVGVIASLTGKGAARGESARQGLELAYEKVRRSGALGTAELRLIYQDVPLDQAKRAPAAFSQLLEAEQVHAIIGPMGSTVSLSVTPLLRKRAVPVIVHTASALKVTQGSDFVFRLWPTARGYVDTIVERVSKLGYRKIAALTTQQDNTIDLINILEEKLKGAEYKIVSNEQVPPEATDFRALLLRAMRSEPDALFLNLFEGQIGLAAKQARELGVDKPIFTNSVMSSVELAAAQQQLEHVWFPRFEGYGDGGRAEFLNKFGEEPSNPESASAAHDALIVLGEAFAKVGSDPAAIRAFLLQGKFAGITGEFEFDPNGDANVPLKIRVVEGGKIIALEESEKSKS